MDEEIRRRDLRVFAREFFSPLPLIGCILAGVIIGFRSHQPFVTFIMVVAAVGIWSQVAWNASKRKRFFDPHFLGLWESCEERHNRFKQVFDRGKKKELTGVVEMPQTIENVKLAIYRALRKADLISQELNVSEGGLGNLPQLKTGSRDAQSQELLQAADRNLAEYRQSLQNLMAGVQRTEAQAAVFMTTIDSLRMRMLGHRLSDRSSELGSHELLAAMAEAKLQLQSIDQALDELDLGIYPQRIAPPSPVSREGVSGLRPPLPSQPPAAPEVALQQEEEQQENRS